MSYQLPLLITVMVITLLYANSKRKSPARKRLCVQTVTVLLMLFSGFRSWWMGDLIKYYTLYRNCNSAEWKSFVFDKFSNVGIRLFFRGAGALHISYDVCLFLIAALVAVALGVLVFRYSPSPYWSYLIYIGMGFYLFTYSGLKQAVAMSFLILAACNYFQGRAARVVLWTLVAALFHAPAMIFLLLFLLPTRRLGTSYFVTIAVLFAACFLFKGPLVTFLSQMYYDEQDAFETINEVGGRFSMMAAIMLAALLLRPLRAWDTVYWRTFNLMVLAALCQVFSVYDNNFSRLADYFYQFSALFIPLMLEPGSDQARRFPEHRHEIRYWDGQLYLLAGLGVTAFSLWYYSSYIQASAPILDNFKFFWQIEAHALYGA